MRSSDTDGCTWNALRPGAIAWLGDRLEAESSSMARRRPTTNWATGDGLLAGQFSSQILFAQARVGHVSDRQVQLLEMAIGCFANLIGQLFSQLTVVLEQYLAAVEIDLQSARLEQWS